MAHQAALGLLQFATASILPAIVRLQGNLTNGWLRGQNGKLHPVVACLMLQALTLAQHFIPSRPLAPVQAALSSPVCAWLLTAVVSQALGTAVDSSALLQPQLAEITLAVFSVMFGTFRISQPAGLAVAIAAGSLVVQQWSVLKSPLNLMKPSEARKARAAGSMEKWHPQIDKLLMAYQWSRGLHVLICTLVGTGVLPGSDTHLSLIARCLWAVSSLAALIAVPQALLYQLAKADCMLDLMRSHVNKKKSGDQGWTGGDASFSKELQSLLNEDMKDARLARERANTSDPGPQTRADTQYADIQSILASYEGKALDSLLTTHLTHITEGDEVVDVSDLLGTGEFGRKPTSMELLIQAAQRKSNPGLKLVVPTSTAGTQTDLPPPTPPPTTAQLTPAAPSPAQPTPAPVLASATAAAVHNGANIGVDGGDWREAIEAVREHASHVAHDLKNPLNGVLALTQTVVQGTFGAVPPMASEQLNVVKSCAYQLLNMINMTRDMLKGLNLGDMGLSCGQCGVTDHVNEAISRLQPMVGNRLAVANNINGDVKVMSDSERLYQVIHVVVANAFKYTRRGSVEVTAEPLQGSNGQYMVLRCADTGTGLSNDQLTKFNSPFSGSLDEQLGLGLLMVKRMMFVWGGQLKITNRSADTKGAVVEFVFRADAHVPPLQQGLPGRGSNALKAGDQGPHNNTRQSAQGGQMGAGGAVNGAPFRNGGSPFASNGGRVTGRAEMAGDNAPAIEAIAMQRTSESASVVAASAAARESTQGGSVGGGVVRSGKVSESGSAVHHQNPSRLTSHNLQRITAGNASTRSQLKEADGSEHSHLRQGSSNHFAGATVLVVEDDVVNLNILSSLLEGAGYDVLTATNANDALLTFTSSQVPVKLVLLDMTLPDMMGDEVCTKIIGLSPGVPPPIIMISGQSAKSQVIKGLAAGAVDYITKPFHPDEVLARVDTHLRLYLGDMQDMQDDAERNMALLCQILPPHILSALKGGQRVMVETFSDVYVLHAEVVGLSSLMSYGDGVECIATLNQLYSIFDQLMDKHAVHKVECMGSLYCAAVGHQTEDGSRSSLAQLMDIVACGQEMLQIARDMTYPESLGKMEVRLGLHVGPLSAGVLGVKFPRYCLFGAAQRLSAALTQCAPPMCLHVSEAIYKRAQKLSVSEFSFIPFTLSSFPGMGIIHTYLVSTAWLDVQTLSGINIPEYVSFLTKSTKETETLQVMHGMVPTPNGHAVATVGSVNSHARLSQTSAGGHTSIDTGRLTFAQKPPGSNSTDHNVLPYAVVGAGTTTVSGSGGYDGAGLVSPVPSSPPRSPGGHPAGAGGVAPGDLSAHMWSTIQRNAANNDRDSAHTAVQNMTSLWLSVPAHMRQSVMPQPHAANASVPTPSDATQSTQLGTVTPSGASLVPTNTSSNMGSYMVTTGATSSTTQPPDQIPTNILTREDEQEDDALPRTLTFSLTTMVETGAGAKTAVRSAAAAASRLGSIASHGGVRFGGAEAATVARSDPDLATRSGTYLDWGDPDEELLEQLGMSDLRPVGNLRSKSMGYNRTPGASKSMFGGVGDLGLVGMGLGPGKRVLPAPRISTGNLQAVTPQMIRRSKTLPLSRLQDDNTATPASQPSDATQQAAGLSQGALPSQQVPTSRRSSTPGGPDPSDLSSKLSDALYGADKEAELVTNTGPDTQGSSPVTYTNAVYETDTEGEE